MVAASCVVRLRRVSTFTPMTDVVRSKIAVGGCTRVVLVGRWVITFAMSVMAARTSLQMIFITALLVDDMMALWACLDRRRSLCLGRGANHTTGRHPFMSLKTSLGNLQVSSVFWTRVTRTYVTCSSRISACWVIFCGLWRGSTCLLSTAVWPSRWDHVDLPTKSLTVLLAGSHLPLTGILGDYVLSLGLSLILTLCCKGEMLLGLALSCGWVHLLSIIVGPICLTWSLNILLRWLWLLSGDPSVNRLETLSISCHIVVGLMPLRLLYKLNYLFSVVKLAIITKRLTHNKLLLIDIDWVTLLVWATRVSTGASSSTTIAIAALQVVDELYLICR